MWLILDQIQRGLKEGYGEFRTLHNDFNDSVV